MNTKEIGIAKLEAERFIQRVVELTETMAKAGVTERWLHNFPRETGAIRRASMDLTRQLAKMRRPM